MPHVPIVILSAAAVVALTASGCSTHHQLRSISESVTPSPTVIAAPAGPLPAPAALTDVMYRLADPAIPGVEKLSLVQNATPSEAATLDKFAAALRDGGFAPVTFEATGIRWSDTEPGDALATITVTTTTNPTTNPTTKPGSPGEFAFPMVFRPTGDGWQLSRETADTLLQFDNAHPVGTPPR